MAKSILDIVIKLSKEGGADKETVAGLVKIKQGIGEAMGVMGAMAAAGYALNQVYQGTVVVFGNYANQVRDVARDTGLSAEESSRLIQAGDDLTISYESLHKALYGMAKKGQEPSIANLEKMADEYLALAPGVERAKYLTDNFGKSGQEMGKLLEQGSAGIEKYTDAVDGNLVLTQKQLDEARQLAVVQDNLNDQWQGIAITVGSHLTPAIAAWLTLINKVTTGAIDQKEVWADLFALWTGNFVPLAKTFGDTFNEMQAQLGGVTEKVKEQTPVVEDNTEAIKAAAAANQDLLDLTMQLQSAEDQHAEKVADIREKMAELNVEYRNGAIDADVYQQKKAELTGALDKEAKAFEESSKRIVFSLLQQNLAVDGLNDKELNMLLTIGEGMGILDSKTATSALSITKSLKAMDTASPKELATILHDLFGIPDEKAQKMVLDNFDTDTTGALSQDLRAIHDLPDKKDQKLGLDGFDTNTTGAVAQSLVSVWNLPDEKHLKLIVDVSYPNGPIPDNLVPTGGEMGPLAPLRMGNLNVGEAGGISSGASGGSAGGIGRSATGGGGGGGIVIHNLHVTLSKGMTAADFEKLLRSGRG